MTLAEFRGIRPATGEGAGHAAAPAHRQGAHPGPAEYVKIGLTLAVITAVEVAIYYIDALSDVLIPILMVLSALKFSLVVMWFMHLKFDNRMFSTFFVGGLMLVAALFVVVLATLGGALV
jgi:cytochrome c oxidase subunit 4